MKPFLASILSAILLTSFSSPSLQKDAKATEILNALSAKTKSYSSIVANFTYSVKSNDMNEEQKGVLRLSGDKYRYSIFGVTKISDGKKICTVSEADEEVIITRADYNDPDEFSPSEIFTIYQTGYKYRYIKETTINEKLHHVIELYPEVEKNNPYRRITMYIEAATPAIYKIDFFHKTSTKVFSITLNSATYNSQIPVSDFNCSCGIKKDYDCDDQTKAK